MTDPARDFFQGADAIQRRPITEAQMRDAVEALQRLFHRPRKVPKVKWLGYIQNPRNPEESAK